MRIGLCGAGGTGKSTFSKLLAAELGLELPPSQSRAVLQEMGIREQDLQSLRPEEALDVQLTMLTRKFKIDQDHPNAVFDRTVIDHFFYTQYRGIVSLDDDEHRTLERLVKEKARIYNQILFCPFYDWAVPPGDIRQDGRAYRYLADRAIYGLLVDSDRPFLTVPNVPPEERLAWYKTCVR